MATQDQLNDVIKQNEFTRVKLWQDNHFNGKGVNILNIDTGDHGGGTDSREHDAALEANIYTVGMSGNTTSSGEMITELNYDGKKYILEEFIAEKKIKILGRSLGGGTAEDTVESHFYKVLRDKYNLIMNHSYGNIDKKGNNPGGSIPHDAAMWWSGVVLNRYGKPVRATWSAYGEQNDFCTFPGFLNGTSFSRPYADSFQAQLIGRYGLETSHQEMFKLMQMLCSDLDIEGYDYNTGWGLPILPTMEQKYITMTIGSKDFKVNGIVGKMDTVPVLVGYHTFVPIRFANEAIGAELKDSYNSDKTMKIKVIKGDTIIELNQNSDVALISKNGSASKRYPLDYPPFIQNNRLMVPLRFLSEHLSCKVDWVQKEQKVMILG